MYPAGSPTDPRNCLLGTSCIDRVDTQTSKNSGLFLNTVTQLTEALSLTVGLRRSEDEKNVLQERFGRNGLYCCGFDPATPVLSKSTSTDPMVSLAYNVNDNIMVYGTYQEGFRGGGTTARPLGGTAVSIVAEQAGLQALTFRRNGSAGEESILYLTSERARLTSGSFVEDTRAVEIERATGRVRCYSYASGAWLQTC